MLWDSILLSTIGPKGECPDKGIAVMARTDFMLKTMLQVDNTVSTCYFYLKSSKFIALCDWSLSECCPARVSENQFSVD